MTESQLQSAVFKWFRSQYNKLPELALAYHVRNEGKHHSAGTKAGIPDICIPAPCGAWGAMYIELKTISGRISDIQYRTMLALQDCGNHVVVCRSLEDVKIEVAAYFAEGKQ